MSDKKPKKSWNYLATLTVPTVLIVIFSIAATANCCVSYPGWILLIFIIPLSGFIPFINCFLFIRTAFLLFVETRSFILYISVGLFLPWLSSLILNYYINFNDLGNMAIALSAIQLPLLWLENRKKLALGPSLKADAAL